MEEDDPRDRQQEKHDEEEREEELVNQVKMKGLSRKEKRKSLKKLKRRQTRKEIALKVREEEEARMNDPEEQRKLEAMEEEEARRRESELKEFEERERAWIQAMELKKKKKKKEEEEREEEEERRRELEESKREQVDNENECSEDDDWEYVEEGPPEIIFQGNEIIFRKKKVRVLKKDANQLSEKEDADRPTSNPLPPQSEVFSHYQKASSAQQLLEHVAQQVPSFGTEQDKAHCPFHLKTGACRFGQRCSRVHFYPDRSCTLLIKNMYNGPGLAWEQDEGLEFTDEEVERYYEEFYEDVHTEFLKFGEIVNFKVCRNGSFHLRGNVYVHYKSLESAALAYNSVSGRYFAGKQITCEFVNVTRWKVAICGEYMKSRLKTCSHGTACNFIHCFRNPGGDYEWADWDKPPPRYWVKKMAALFGYLDEYEKQMEEEHLEQLKDSSKTVTADSYRQSSRRSRSNNIDHLDSGSGRIHHGEDVQGRTHRHRHRHRHRDTTIKNYRRSDSRSHSCYSDEDSSDRDADKDGDGDQFLKRQITEYIGYQDKKKRSSEAYSDDNGLDRDGDGQRHLDTKKSSRHHRRRALENGRDCENTYEADQGHSDDRREGRKHHGLKWRSSRQQSNTGSLADHGNNKKRNHDTDITGEWSDGEKYESSHHHHKRRSLGHCEKVSESPDDHGDSRYRYRDFDSDDDRLDKDRGRHNHHRRKCSSHSNEVTEYSGDQEEPRTGLKGKSKSKRVHTSSHSSRKDD